MKIVEEAFWKNTGQPTIFVISAGKHDNTLFEWGIVSQASARIPRFHAVARKALESNSGFVIGAEPVDDRSGWGILRVGYVEMANLAAISAAMLDLDIYTRSHPEYNFRITYPGLEHLAPEIVEPVLAMLPDNVTAVRYMKIPELAPSKMDIKDVYWIVKNHLMYGQHELAKAFLKSIGVDNPLEQIRGVQDMEENETWQKRKLRKLRSPMG